MKMDIYADLIKRFGRQSILTVLLLTLLSGPLLAQGWLHQYGDVGNEGSPVGQWGQAVAPTPDGGSMVVAHMPLAFAPPTPIYLFKTNADGEIVFEKWINENDRLTYPMDIEPKQGGGYWVTGVSRSAGNADDVFAMEIDEEGTVVWYQDYDFMTTAVGYAIAPLADGGAVITGSVSADPDFLGAFIYKIDAQGDFLWERNYTIGSGSLGSGIGTDILEDENGDLVVAGLSWLNDPLDNLITQANAFKTNLAGDLIWTYEDDRPAGSAAYSLSRSATGNYVLSGQTTDPVRLPLAIQLDATGMEVWQTTIDQLPGSGGFWEVQPRPAGGYLLTGTALGSFSGDVIISQIDESGLVQWTRQPNRLLLWSATSFYQRPDGCLIFCGSLEDMSTDRDVFLLKTDSLGQIFTNVLEGYLRADLNLDCDPDPNATDVFPGWAVQAIGSQGFVTLTDSSGFFQMLVDTGSYEVEVIPPSPYWAVCDNPTSANLTAFYDTLSIDFPVQQEVLCPFLEVSITTPFLRRCFENTYTVHFCNTGTIAAHNTLIEVELDSFLTFLSASIPWSNQNGNTLTFTIDTVAVNECGSFEIEVLLDCDSTILGQAHCSSAHIYPDSLCLPLNPVWDESSIEVDATCTGDSIFFHIQNTGDGNMGQALNYIIIEDQIVLLQDEFQLPAGETIKIPIESSGGTFHLEAEQSIGHPTGVPSTGASIEGCGGWLSLGLFTQYTNPDASPFVDIDCQENIGSFDPNDKSGFPRGFGDEHLIEPQDELEYLIRFQNTGTDTAFTVRIVDALPPSLDLLSLQPGAASHSYTYSISPEGWPVFTFENIALPDSNINEAASHGFVRFRVAQMPGNGYGDYIENEALIFFDFNAPIVTNLVRHKVGQIYPWTIVGTDDLVAEGPSVRIQPNPLSNQAFLTLEQVPPGYLELVVVNVNGQTVYEASTYGNQFELQRNQFESGMFFFKIRRDGAYIGSGKLFVK